jgi:hypothetical protein
MSSIRQDSLRPSQHQSESWRASYPVATRNYGGLSWRLLATGAVVVGLGLLAWNLGPDLRRYIKIERM